LGTATVVSSLSSSVDVRLHLTFGFGMVNGILDIDDALVLAFAWKIETMIHLDPLVSVSHRHPVTSGSHIEA